MAVLKLNGPIVVSKNGALLNCTSPIMAIGVFPVFDIFTWSVLPDSLICPNTSSMTKLVLKSSSVPTPRKIP